MIFHNLKHKDAESTRQKIIDIFKTIGFDIEININLKTVDFLDLTLGLIDWNVPTVQETE